MVELFDCLGEQQRKRVSQEFVHGNMNILFIIVTSGIVFIFLKTGVGVKRVEPAVYH